MNCLRLLLVVCAMFVSTSVWCKEGQQVDFNEYDKKTGLTLGEGTRLLKSGMPSEAIQQFDKVIASYEECYKDTKVKIFSLSGDPLEVHLYFNEAANSSKVEAIVVSSNWADAYYFKAFALIDLGRLAEAKTYLDRALSLASHNSQYLWERANLYLKEKNWAQALPAFQLAEAAAKDFSPAVLKNQQLAAAWRGIGFVYIELKRFDEAEKMYRQCLELDKNDTKALQELQYIQSMRAKEKATAQVSTNQKPTVLIETRLPADANKEKAEQEIRDQFNRVKSETFAKYGWDELKAGKNEAAISSFQRSLQLKPDLIDAHVGLGYAYGLADRDKEAFKAFREAILLDSGNIKAHWGLGTASLKLGDRETAIQTYKNLQTLDPDLAKKFEKLLSIDKNADGKKDDKPNGNGTLNNANGDKYVGDLKDGKPDGNGTYTFKDGEQYAGTFKNGMLNGNGTITKANGGKLVGNFKDGQLNGNGTLTYPSGIKYDGEFKNGRFDGKGTITDANGGKYVGEFKDDKRNGKGTLTFANGDQYVGDFIDGKPSENGMLTYKDGRKYVGSFKDDKPQGSGTLTYVNGGKYVGDFKDGKRNGNGTHTWVSGDKYIGEFKDDKRNGNATYTHANGDKYVGTYKDDKRNGNGTLTWASGGNYVGEFKDDARNGNGTHTWASGDKYVGEYKDGKRNGNGTLAFAGGNKYVGEYKDDMRNGNGTYTYASGEKYSGAWENDKKHGQGTLTLKDGTSSKGLWEKGEKVKEL